jgi:predicted phage terminase large subunit-like protein
MTAPAWADELAELLADAWEADTTPDQLAHWLPTALPDYTWDAPHLVAMMAVLDRVTAGDLRRAYFQIPIRHGKSTLNTLGYAVYRLERDPRTRIVIGSYNQRQADKFSRDIRRLARARGVSISDDRDAAGEWETTAGGGVRAVGAGAGLASVNADLILIDDPIGSRDDAESPAKRDQVWDWVTNDVLARAEPHTAVLMTMSRWHQDDPAGRLLEQQRERWHVLDLPARAEAGDALGRPEGAPLWPQMRGESWLDEKLIELTPYGFASLLQGRPRPREGGLIQWAWWQTMDALPTPLPPVVRYWDMAGTRPKGGGHDPDYTAGVAGCRLRDGRTLITDVCRFRSEVAARDAAIVAQARADLATYGRGKVTYWLEAQAGISGEDATNALLRQLQALGLAAYSERPTGSKIERATPLASAALAGNVYLGPESGSPWRDAFRLECADAPTGRHDDQLDAAAGMFAKLSAPTAQVGTFRPRV